MDLSLEEIVPINETTNLGNSSLTFDGLLPEPGLQVVEDGGAAGCGGKLWPAGELLSKYMIRRGLKGAKNIVELGSGTGLVGLAIGLDQRRLGNDDFTVWITDQENMMPLMEENVKLNQLNTVKAAVLNWGDELPEYAKTADLILAADCVYLEAAFPLLEKTLLDLTENGTPILLCYKKRRRADSRFFKKIKKNFVVTEIKDHEDYEHYFRQAVYLYEFARKTNNSNK